MSLGHQSTTTERPPAGSGGSFMCSGTRCSCGFSIRAPVNCYANIWARSGADIASAIGTTHGACRYRSGARPSSGSARRCLFQWDGGKHMFSFGTEPVRSNVRRLAVPVGAPTYSVEPVLELAFVLLQLSKNDCWQG